MPNKPGPAREKRPPTPKRQNDQADHEGSPHTPDAFDDQNPQKLKEKDD